MSSELDGAEGCNLEVPEVYTLVDCFGRGWLFWESNQLRKHWALYMLDNASGPSATIRRTGCAW